MYNTRTILILLLVAVVLLGVSLFLLLVWTPPKEEARETTPVVNTIPMTPTTLSIPATGEDAPVSHSPEPGIVPLGSDHGMEFPTIDDEIPSR